jgi:tRNA A64-2'-O-ribosylphosphate transferase
MISLSVLFFFNTESQASEVVDLQASFYVLPKLQYPLRPIWITPSTTTFPIFPDTDAERRFYPIICISASKQVLDGMERRITGFAYIQGLGDDHELWSMVRIIPLAW